MKCRNVKEIKSHLVSDSVIVCSCSDGAVGRIILSIFCPILFNLFDSKITNIEDMNSFKYSANCLPVNGTKKTLLYQSIVQKKTCNCNIRVLWSNHDTKRIV